MNTVDALKKLYKTLAGKDYAGDPNPTDAEMIDAIAKDATPGGGSGGTGLPEIVFQADFTDVTTPEEAQTKTKFAILTSKEEVMALAKMSSNCVVGVNLIDPNNVSAGTALEMRIGKNYGLLCRLFYRTRESEVEGSANEEYLDLYCYDSTPYWTQNELIALSSYDSSDGQWDIWADGGHLKDAAGQVLGHFILSNN